MRQVLPSGPLSVWGGFNSCRSAHRASESTENCENLFPILLAKVPAEFKPLAAQGIGAFVPGFFFLGRSHN
jgi:hypothetical protein